MTGGVRTMKMKRAAKEPTGCSFWVQMSSLQVDMLLKIYLLARIHSFDVAVPYDSNPSYSCWMKARFDSID
jgi:hypothetical protein